MSTAYDAHNIAKSAVRSVETRIFGLADGPVDSTVTPRTAPATAHGRAGFGTKMTLAAILAVTALGAKATPAKADISDFPSTKFEWSLTYNGPVENGLHNWTGWLYNVSTGDNSDAGKDLKVFAQDLSDPSYSGGMIGDNWRTVQLTEDALFADCNGAPINPYRVSPSKSRLYVSFNSPFDTAISSTIQIHTDAHGMYTIENASVPGEIPAVPVPGAAVLAVAAAPVVAAGLNRMKREKSNRK